MLTVVGSIFIIISAVIINYVNKSRLADVDEENKRRAVRERMAWYEYARQDILDDLDYYIANIHQSETGVSIYIKAALDLAKEYGDKEFINTISKAIK